MNTTTDGSSSESLPSAPAVKAQAEPDALFYPGARPGDDDREAIIRIAFLSPNALIQHECERIADALIAAGFARPSTPQSSACVPAVRQDQGQAWSHDGDHAYDRDGANRHVLAECREFLAGRLEHKVSAGFVCTACGLMNAHSQRTLPGSRFGVCILHKIDAALAASVEAGPSPSGLRPSVAPEGIDAVRERVARAMFERNWTTSSPSHALPPTDERRAVVWEEDQHFWRHLADAALAAIAVQSRPSSPEGIDGAGACRFCGRVDGPWANRQMNLCRNCENARPATPEVNETP